MLTDARANARARDAMACGAAAHSARECKSERGRPSAHLVPALHRAMEEARMFRRT